MRTYVNSTVMGKDSDIAISAGPLLRPASYSELRGADAEVNMNIGMMWAKSLI